MVFDACINNFEITDPGVRVWRAYGIGTGKLLKSENLSSLPSHNTVTCLKQPGNKGTFKEMISGKKEPIQASQSEHVEDNRADDGTMEEGHEGLFFCPEPNCQRSFQDIAYLEHVENHVLTGKHVYELQKLTLHNKARIGYAEGCKPGTSKQLLSSGWALKQTKKSKRFSKNKTKTKQNKTNKQKQNKTKQKKKQKQKQKQKDYLQKKFQVGMECGKKCQPSEVVRDMQRAKGDSGVKLWPRWVRWRISPSSRRRICTGQPTLSIKKYLSITL